MHPAGPAAANRSINASNRSRSVVRSRSSRTTRSFIVGEFRRIGSSFLSAKGFTIHPKIRPTNTRGGVLSPSANSKPAEQCATACGAFIVPHNRSLSGLSNAIRFFTSCTLVASKRFFMYVPRLWSARVQNVMLSKYKSTTPAKPHPQLLINEVRGDRGISFDPACVALLVDITVATLTSSLSTLPNGLSPLSWFDDLLYLPEVLYVIFFIWLICSGPRKFSVDY